MWRLIKAIVVSWLVGLVCGIGMVIVVQKHDQSPPPPNASMQRSPQTSGAGTATPSQKTE
jgi:hypothetical protein